MVVDEIDLISIAVVEAENKAPVTGNRNRPQTRQIAFKTMQAVSRQIHVFGFISLIQARKYPFELFRILRLHLPAVPILEEKAETFVPKAQNHLVEFNPAAVTPQYES
jgi:hypothetical protein